MSTIKIVFIKEVVNHLHQLGKMSAAQLQTHLPDHDVESVAEAMEVAVRQNLIQPCGDGTYECLPAGVVWVDPKPDAVTIVENALSKRTALELAWTAA